MTYSLMWSLVNALHFKKPIDIWGNFVPGMIFFQGIFGYLVFTIFYKWSVDWYAEGRQPPSLLNMLIYMFLQPGTVDEELYGGQATLQTILLGLAVIQVPIMLFLKPFYLRWEHNKARAKGYRGIGETSHVSALDDDDDEGERVNGRHSFNSVGDGGMTITQDIGGSEEHGEFEFSEEMIHQVIHTIGMFLQRFLTLSSTDLFRILLELCLPHSFLLTSLGFIVGPSTTFYCPLAHDHRYRL